MINNIIIVDYNMKIKDVLRKPTKFERLLKEALSGEFTFGFELEAVCRRPKGNDFRLPSYDSYNENSSPVTGGAVTDVKNDLDSYFGIGTIENDSSLGTSNDDEWTFEYSSPKIPFNPANIKKLYKMLTDLDKLDIYTNRSCGFHIHFSYPDITRNDIAWIVCCIAIDEKLKNDLFILDAGTSEITLFDSEYASIDFLGRIKKSIEDENFSTLSILLSNEKKRVLRIHPQGTLEWRGPRGFLNANDPSIIKLMIQKIYNFVLKLSKLSQVNPYKYDDLEINKKELISNLNISSTKFNSDIEKIKKKKLQNIEEIISDKPNIIFDMKASSLERLFKKGLTWQIVRAVNEITKSSYSKEWNEMSDSLFNEIVECRIKYQKSSSKINYKDPSYGEELYDFIYKLDSSMSIDNIYDKLSEKNKDLLRNYMSSELNNRLFDNSLDKIIFNKFNVIDSDYFKKDLKNNKNEDKNKFYKNILFLCNRMTSDITDVFYKNNMYSYLSIIDDMPTSMQMKLVKKNPYNIQYIKHPSEKVLNYVKKKEPDALEYVLGEEE